jgi:hypothetical protein
MMRHLPVPCVGIFKNDAAAAAWNNDDAAAYCNKDATAAFIK